MHLKVILFEIFLIKVFFKKIFLEKSFINYVHIINNFSIFTIYFLKFFKCENLKKNIFLS